MIRIIAGEFKGYKLKSGLDRPGFRPTKDRVKESMFSILGDIKDKKVIDLFAGSGNLGFEAISRGARQVTFVENNFKQTNIIKENAEKLKALDRVQLISQNVLSFLKNCHDDYDLILADPPYKFRFLDSFVDLLTSKFSKGMIVFEIGESYEVDEKIKILEPNIKVYGNTKLIIFRNKNEKSTLSGDF